MDENSVEKLGEIGILYLKVNEILLGKIHPFARRISIEVNSLNQIFSLTFCYDRLDPVQEYLENEIIDHLKKNRFLSDSFEKIAMIVPYPNKLYREGRSLYNRYEECTI
jgi:hypothetical protein